MVRRGPPRPVSARAAALCRRAVRPRLPGNCQPAQRLRKLRFRTRVAHKPATEEAHMPAVLIVGAGPTGLVLALWLRHFGVSVRLIDRASAPGTTSRALAVQARTLELYEQLGLAAAVLERGHQVPAVNLWVGGKHRARLDFLAISSTLTRYPFLEILPQDEHEELLSERLAQTGGLVERSTELIGLRAGAGAVEARLRRPDGREEHYEAAYLVGCDGARSRVRELLQVGFPGGTYPQVFYVADIQGAGTACNGELHVDLDEADFVAVFPLAGAGRARLIGTVRGERAAHAESLSFADVQGRALRSLGLQVEHVHWFSTYHVHHRVAAHFRSGRVFLAGDAAHIHSPAGGQGMNTGIGDAVNLAWKLAAVLRGTASSGLLDTYESERITFARRLVATTDRVFTFVSAPGAVADLVRTRLAPLVLPPLVRLDAVREFLFRTVSQTMINYRGRPLSVGRVGGVRGGERLPWVDSGADNYQALREARWQLHVYGAAQPALAGWCDAQRMPLHVFPFTAAHRRAGLRAQALYLLRPDGYVALASGAQEPDTVVRYFAARGLRWNED
jgi:2-polyprenyl-6-methoxyphenol hydroxylase-like FAD-dependent oxidoreductase